MAGLIVMSTTTSFISSLNMHCGSSTKDVCPPTLHVTVNTGPELPLIMHGVSDRVVRASLSKLKQIIKGSEAKKRLRFSPYKGTIQAIDKGLSFQKMLH